MPISALKSPIRTGLPLKLLSAMTRLKGMPKDAASRVAKPETPSDLKVISITSGLPKVR